MFKEEIIKFEMFRPILTKVISKVPLNYVIAKISLITMNKVET